MSACTRCAPTPWSQITGRCNPNEHTAGGSREFPPFRPGKTQRDHRSGAWSRRLANRAKRAAEQAA